MEATVDFEKKKLLLCKQYRNREKRNVSTQVLQREQF
jgi:hypothetical protein